MEFALKKISVGTLFAQPDTVCEQPVDIDFTLPDYCPDIEKILKCSINPKIYNKALSGGQLTVDGATVVSVLYLDPDNNLRICEQTVPYSAAVAVKETPDCYALDIGVKPEYVNCRALSRRRLTVHGAFSLSVRVLQSKAIELSSPDENTSLEFLTEDIAASSLSAFCSEQFTAGDEIKISGKPPVNVVIDSSVRAEVTGFRIVPDKLMLEGELNVHILYLSRADSAQVEQLDCTVPFSQVADCRGLGEDSEVCVSLSVLSHDIRLKNEAMSDSPNIIVDARVNALVFGYGTETVPVILDAYSTELPVTPELSSVNIPYNTTVLSDSFIYKDVLDDLPLSEIIDIRADIIPLTPAVGEKNVALNARMLIKILGKNNDGEIVYIERSRELSRDIAAERDFDSVENVFVSVRSLSYRMGDNNTVELRIDIKYCLTLSETKSLNVVSAVNADENTKLNRKKCALILYYADEGERLWDIGKYYNTGLKMISAENDLEEDVLTQPRMLLIPTA